MNKLRRIIAGVSALAMTASFAGCSGSSESGESTETTMETTTALTVEINTETLSEEDQGTMDNVADLLPDARNYYAPVMTLPMGAKVDAGFSEQFERYAFVVLPDKRTFYIHKKALAPLPKEPQSEEKTRELIVENASKYLNVQYRWGGKTHAGIDCSGLAFMACHMAGINIWRDADFDKTPRLREIERDAAQPGDLYFFSGHIAVAIGDGDFIHATAAEGKVTYGTFEPKSAFYRKWYDENFIRAGSLF